MSKIGKRVVDDLYVHLSALDYLEDLEQRQRIEAALQHLSAPTHHIPSVAKLNLRTGRLSLLAYRIEGLAGCSSVNGTKINQKVQFPRAVPLYAKGVFHAGLDRR